MDSQEVLHNYLLKRYNTLLQDALDRLNKRFKTTFSISESTIEDTDGFVHFEFTVWARPEVIMMYKSETFFKPDGLIDIPERWENDPRVEAISDLEINTDGKNVLRFATWVWLVWQYWVHL